MAKLLTTIALIGGALLLQPVTAHALPSSDSFCGPQPVGGCELGTEQKVFLQQGKAQMTVVGNVGGPSNSLPVIDFHSDMAGQMLAILLDSGGGFSTITPAGKATFFNGLDVTIPGYEFTGLIFSAQLEPVGSESTDAFTIEGFTGLGVNRTSDGLGNETDSTNTDKEFAIYASSGTFFDDVNIFSITGFHEIKQVEVEGLCAIQSNGSCTPVVFATPEPAALALLGVGLLGTLAIRRRQRR